MSKPIKRVMKAAFPEPPSWLYAGIGTCASCSAVRRVFWIRWMPRPRYRRHIRLLYGRNEVQFGNGAHCVVCMRRWRENAVRYAGTFGPASTYRWYASLGEQV